MSIQTISDLMDYYFSRKILADKTRQQYELVTRLFVRDVTDQIARLDEDLLLVWRDHVIQRASGATFNNYLRHLRSIFNYGVKRKQVDDNPFSIIEAAPRVYRKPKIITQSQYNRLIAYVKHSDEMKPSWFWVAVIEFMATTGVRGRQVIELKWKDINFDKSTIRLRTEGSKSRREWFIPLPDAIGDVLYEWYFRFGVYKSPSLMKTQVFNVTQHHSSYIGCEMTITQLNDFFSRLSSKIGFRIGCKKLRHSLGTYLGNYSDTGEGYLFALRDLLGHTDIRTTQIYVSGNVGRIRKMLNDSGISSGRSNRNKVNSIDFNKKSGKL